MSSKTPKAMGGTYPNIHMLRTTHCGKSHFLVHKFHLERTLPKYKRSNTVFHVHKTVQKVVFIKIWFLNKSDYFASVWTTTSSTTFYAFCSRLLKISGHNSEPFLGDMLAKPFTFVSGNTKKSRFNPFRKKSGLLNVLARQSTKNRICFKNGYLNTFTPTDENQAHKFLQVCTLLPTQLILT